VLQVRGRNSDILRVPRNANAPMPRCDLSAKYPETEAQPVTHQLTETCDKPDDRGACAQ